VLIRRILQGREAVDATRTTLVQQNGSNPGQSLVPTPYTGTVVSTTSAGREDTGATRKGKGEQFRGNEGELWTLRELRNHDIAFRGLAGGAPRARILSIVVVHPLNVWKRGGGWDCVFEVVKVNIVNPKKS